MGKRSDFERVERDFYPTPKAAVVPLVPWLRDGLRYWEPCAGDGQLVRNIHELSNAVCVAISDIEPRGPDPRMQQCDALKVSPDAVDMADADYIITNPPWDRKILHPMIEHFSSLRPTWLLFDADWCHTLQSSHYMKYCHKIVSVGRVKWIPGSKMTGKDNTAWYLFDQNKENDGTVFYGR